MDFYNNIDVYGPRTALITERSERVSYAELLRAADIFREYLQDRCLLFSVCTNTLESVACYIGCLRARTIPLLINDTMNAELFSTLMSRYKPRYIWMPAEKATAVDGGSKVYRYREYVLLRTSYQTNYATHDDLALLLTTSGSTGSPMLVRQSYKNLRSNANAIATYLGITQSDRPITTLPMSYTYGLSVINSHFLKGCTVILTNRSITEKAFWDHLKTHEVTTLSGVPYTYEMLKRLRFSRMSLPSLKTLTQAGGRLSRELSKEFATVCKEKGIRFFVMYGQTEATARMSYLPSEYAITKAGSVGIPIPGGEFWLEDESGAVIAESETVGELVYKGNDVTMGYATDCRDLCKGDENRGVLRTGDMAKRDSDGFYYIVGRKKRFLKVFGNRLNLDELEQLIRKGGFNCACSGEDDHVRIFVSERGQEAAIRRFVSERTGIHPTAYDVIFIKTIPRNEVGKILYSALDLGTFETASGSHA